VPTLRWCHLGRVEYDAARALQDRLATLRARGGCGDLLLLLEHPPVVTVGRNGIAPSVAVPVVRTDRGGNATYHGPGQIVGYPVVALRSSGRGVRAFVAGLEAALCATAAACGVTAHVRPGLPGVWVGGPGVERKLASIGLAVRRGVTSHGCALNVDARAERGFRDFEPCGLPGIRATSLAAESSTTTPEVERVGELLAQHLGHALGLRAERITPQDLPAIVSSPSAVPTMPADGIVASSPSAVALVAAEVTVEDGHQPAS